mgnify:CR=1 FL=1
MSEDNRDALRLTKRSRTVDDVIEAHSARFKASGREAKERARTKMIEAIRLLSEAIENDTLHTLKFEELYSAVFQANAPHDLGNEWHEAITHEARRLAHVLRNDRKMFDVGKVAHRDVSLFPQNKFCLARGWKTVTEVFDAEWYRWVDDRALRAWTLWERVRRKKLLLRTLLGLYEIASLRPGNTGFLRLQKTWLRRFED